MGAFSIPPATMVIPFTIEHPLAQACIGGDFLEPILLKYIETIEEETQQGNTPLHLAVTGEDIQTITFLLENGANPNNANAYGETPLHWAAEYNHTRVIELLRNRGASTKLRNES